MKYLVLIGRILFSAIFIISGINNLFNSEMIQYGISHGVPYPSFMIPVSGLISLIGGLSILMGYKARMGAWLIIFFLIPVTLMMHNFWEMDDSQQIMIEQILFLNNVSMLGGAFLLAYFGSGPLSIDHQSAKIYPFINE